MLIKQRICLVLFILISILYFCFLGRYLKDKNMNKYQEINFSDEIIWNDFINLNPFNKQLYSYFKDIWVESGSGSFNNVSDVNIDVTYFIENFDYEMQIGLCSSQLVYSLLQLIIENKIRLENTDLLYYIKNNGSWLYSNDYRKLGYSLFCKLEEYDENLDPEINMWKLSGFMMSALDASTSLEKIDIVDKASQKIDLVLQDNKFNRNFVCNCIAIETYISLPDFFTDQKERSYSLLCNLIDLIKNNEDFYITDEKFNQIKSNSYEYLYTIYEHMHKDKYYRKECDLKQIKNDLSLIIKDRSL